MTKTLSASKGALAVVGMRWTNRLIGIVSTVILARLLVPEDFGIIAMASIVIGLIDVLLDMGVNVTVRSSGRQHRGCDRRERWTRASRAGAHEADGP